MKHYKSLLAVSLMLNGYLVIDTLNRETETKHTQELPEKHIEAEVIKSDEVPQAPSYSNLNEGLGKLEKPIEEMTSDAVQDDQDEAELVIEHFKRFDEYKSKALEGSADYYEEIFEDVPETIDTSGAYYSCSISNCYVDFPVQGNKPEEVMDYFSSLNLWPNSIKWIEIRNGKFEINFIESE